MSKNSSDLTVIKNSLKYYDKNTEKYKKIKKKIKDVKFERNELSDLIFTFLDKDGKILFTSRVELIGRHYTNSKIWIWGWALPKTQKNDISLIRELLMYGTNLYIKGDYSNELILKAELVTSRFQIDNDIQVEMHCALASYLAKIPFIYKMIEDETEIQSFFFIIDPPGLDD